MKTKLIAVPIPSQYNWMAIDGYGDLVFCTHKMHPKGMLWISDNKESMSMDLCGHDYGKVEDWTKTLERIVEIEWV